MANIESYLNEKRQIIDKKMAGYLVSPDKYSEPLSEAISYSLFAGGKRIRPILTLAALEAVGGDIETALPVASAIEMIHTYSLVHDDLPSMDNDDYRRGKLTNHKVFGEAIAILVGDALLTLAFTIISDSSINKRIDPERSISVIHELGYAAGWMGMIGGQASDIQIKNRKIDEDTLHYIHTSKTGSLIKASVRIGGILGNAAEEQLNDLSLYGEKIGLAFQIADDIIDVEGSMESVGKATGKDETKEKWTYPLLFGLEEAKRMEKILVKDAISSLDRFDKSADKLRDIAQYIITRKK
ncbi:MAG: polyprenyl synthetase family protein [Nitrospirota bacterium]